MVNNVSALGCNGVCDWILLRISAIIISLYIIYLLGFIITTDTITYVTWRGFFDSSFTKIFTILTLLSTLIHGWIGIWQVLTDYINSLIIRVILQFTHILVLLGYVIYGTIVIWSA
ncbi:MAG: succinate dehydrogenase, hydrophobic membrane anchor protein [Candidatus Dasytiphilus stammeri]